MERSDSNGGEKPAPENYSLTLKGEGMSVDRKIDEATALEVLSIVMGGGSPHAGGAMGREGQKTQRGRGGSQSLREYLDAVEPKRNPDRILAIANYVALETGKDFTRDDVKGRFKDAAEPVPGNYKRDFTWAVKNGWIAPSLTTPGEYYVTDTGHKALEEKFSAEIRKKTGVEKGRRRSKTTKATSS